MHWVSESDIAQGTLWVLLSILLDITGTLLDITEQSDDILS